MNILTKAIKELNKINRNKVYRDYAKILNNTKLSQFNGIIPSIKDLQPFDIFLLERLARTSYSIVQSQGTVQPGVFNVLGESGEITLDDSDEIKDQMNDYQGTLTSTGSLTINANATVKSNIDLTSLESDATYVFSIIGNKSFGYFCAINKFS